MDYGAYDELVDLQSRGTTSSDLGAAGPKDSDFTTVESIYAKVKTLTGREMMMAQATFADATCKVWIHARSDVTTEHRLLRASGRKLRILFINDDNPLELELLCAEWRI